MSLQELNFKSRFDAVRGNLQKLHAAFKIYSSEQRSTSMKLDKLTSEHQIEEKTRDALEHIAGLSSSNIGLILNQALRAIYQRDYSFTREAKSVVVLGSDGDFDLTERGGGLTDLLSVILRVIVTAQNKAGSLRTIILDEPFTNVDHAAAVKATHFLLKLGEKLDMNYVTVTHRPALLSAADQILRFKKVGDETKVEILKLDQLDKIMEEELVTEEEA